MPTDPAALEPLLLLAQVRGVGPQRCAALIRRFGSAERVLAAAPRELAAQPGIGEGVIAGIVAAGAPAARERARRAVRGLGRVGAVAITPEDPEYPASFRLLADAPFLLFAAGDLELLDTAGVAVVGTRAPTEYGRSTTASLSEGIAAAGIAVVSGMARGIDTVAHAAALRRGGRSVGVLGHGVDQVYPPENRALFARMREQGLLISEFLPGERPLAGNFPRRNRLIAALSRVVLVVEMGLRSGAQHTVTFALELGREVMAVPGPIGAPTSAGTNQLIKDGARLVTSLDDVLEEFGAARPAVALSPAPPQAMLPLRTVEEQSVLDRLATAPGPLHVDELASATALPTGRLLALLLEMELGGAVQALPGKLYRTA